MDFTYTPAVDLVMVAGQECASLSGAERARPSVHVTQSSYNAPSRSCPLPHSLR